MGWSYDKRDPGIGLFNAALLAGAPMPFTPGMRVLEIACCEADWLHIAAAAWPEGSFVGVDCRAPDDIEENGRIVRMRQDIRQTDLFTPESFDAIVSLSAIEHIGLGHYGDPKDPDGDTKAMANVFRWLKPGGWVYFDVPYDPTGYREIGTECRVYDEPTRFSRLWSLPIVAQQQNMRAKWAWEGYSWMREPLTLIPKPTPETHRDPFAYAAVVWQKVGKHG